MIDLLDILSVLRQEIFIENVIFADEVPQKTRNSCSVSLKYLPVQALISL